MRCCIAECKSQFKNGIRSHCIPALPALRARWLEAIKVVNPGPNDRICSRHFAPSDYHDHGTENTRPSLSLNAVPTQNLPTLETNRGFDPENKIRKTQLPDYDSFVPSDGYQLNFDDDIGEDERRFYLKLFPLVNLVREKKTHCTSCNIHLGTAPANEHNVKMHPILKVTQCKKCHDFYNSGEFSKGEDGSELYCRWCGQGGEVYCCAKCPYVFCKACIGGNLAKSLVADIRDNENWSCFVCSPKITWPIRAVHWALKNYIEKQKQSILLTNSNENEIRRLMKKDTSSCCRGKITGDEESSNDSDLPIKKTYTPAASLVRKRKKSSEEILGQPKPKILNSILTGTTNPTTILQKPVTIAPNPQQALMLNSGVIIQKHPLTTAGTSNSGTAVIRPIQHNQTQVKIVQLTNQHNKTVNVPINVTHGAMQTAPPPLLIRNRGVQIRQHPGNLQNRSMNRSTATTTTAPSTASITGVSNNEHTPVYHTIGGFCIDLNSAAQHDSIRLPNGKLIQVKKSSNNTNPTPPTVAQRNQLTSGILQPQPTQPQQHFTITQPIQQQQSNNASNSIQTIPASAIIPNASGSLQIINGNVIQQIQNQQQQQQQQQQNQSIIRSTNGPILIRSFFPNTAVGKARNQLQNQIFTAMDICQHLSGKIQTLTNSNPYKNANSHIDVKELYIHLSYLFTYAIGRFKNLQDKCNEDMTSMGFNTDVSKLTKGQLAAEKYASDGDEDEIEIVEPKTTTIDLDSDNEDSIQSNKKSNEPKLTNNIVSIMQRLQVAKQQQMLRDKQNQQSFTLQQFQDEQKNNIPQSEDNEYDLPLTLLAGMLEVELTEGNDSLNSTSSSSTLPKKPRKKTTHKPNPHLIKQQKEQLRSKYDEIKRCDVKLKQECNIIIDPLDLDIDDVKKAFQRYSEQQNDDDDNSDYDMMEVINNNDDFNNSGNLDDNTVEVMQLLEVTMDGGEELNNSENNSIDEINKLGKQQNENKSQSNEEVHKKNECDGRMQADESISIENSSEKISCESTNSEKQIEANSLNKSVKNIENEESELAKAENNEKILDNTTENDSVEQEIEKDNAEEKTSEQKIEKDTADEEIEKNCVEEKSAEGNTEKDRSEKKIEKDSAKEKTVEENIEKGHSEENIERGRSAEKIENDSSEEKIENHSVDEISKDHFEHEHTKEGTTPELNEDSKLDAADNSVKPALEDNNLNNDLKNVKVPDVIDNCNSSYNGETKAKSNDELKELSNDAVFQNIAENIITTENKTAVDNVKKAPGNIDSTDIADDSELKSKFENESNIYKTTDNATIESMDVDSSLLNIQNSNDFIDELLADAVKTKPSVDDDFVDHQLSNGLLTGE